MNLDRLVVQFTGGGIGSGVAVHYAESGTTGGQPGYKAFWQTVAPFMFSGVSIHVPNSGDQVDAATGALVGTWTGGTESTFSGSGAGANFAAGVGVSVQWNTSTIVPSRVPTSGPKRLKGRTFIVPLAIGQYDTDGTIYGPTVSALVDACNVLRGAVEAPMIWHRPEALTGGVAGLITSSTVRDHVGWLRSRR